MRFPRAMDDMKSLVPIGKCYSLRIEMEFLPSPGGLLSLVIVIRMSKANPT